MRLIDADALMADFQKAFPNFDVKSSHAKALLATAPTIKAEPIKHGRWKHHQYGNTAGYYECDNCGKINSYKSDYCPNCGARMDEVEENV